MTKSPKPAFPAWLRRIDPTLEAEDRNALFQAFRGHRVRKARTLGGWVDGLLLWIPGSWLLFMLVAVATVTYVPSGACCLLPLGVVAMAMARRSLQTRHARGERLPLRVSGVYSIHGYRKDVAIDLWLTGATARDVLQAIYLEHRERTWRSAIVLCLLAAIGSAAFYLRVFGFTWLALPTFAMVAALAWQFYNMCVLMGLGNTCDRELKPRIQMWGAVSPMIQTVGWAATKGLAFVFASGAGLAALLFFFVVLGSAIQMWEYSASGRSNFLFQSQCVLLVLMGGLTLVLRWFRQQRQRQAVAELDALVETARSAFEDFMAGQIAGDPEASEVGAWAAWRDRKDNAPWRHDDFLAKNAKKHPMKPGGSS